MPDHRFTDKIAWAKRSQPSLPTPLAENVGMWHRLSLLYGRLKDARDAAGHRRARPLDGAYAIYDRQRRETDRISKEEISAFIAVVHGVAQAVIEAENDSRVVGMIRWYLNQLQARRELPDLSGAVVPHAGVGLVVIDALPVGDGRLRVALARIQGITTTQAPSIREVELRAGARVFVARWEDFPTGTGQTLDLDPDAPPEWLVERLV